MSEQRREPDGEELLRNNNQQIDAAHDGDANANDIPTVDGGRTGDVGTISMSRTSEQDKIIIWGTDSQCDDPELAEFEMLECQELEAYLVEDGEDFVGIGERKDPFSSCSNAMIEPTPNTFNNKEEKRNIQHGSSEREATVPHVSDNKGMTACVSRTEFSSETDVYVSCLSTVSSFGGSFASALDTADKTQTMDSWNVPSVPCRTISEDLTLDTQSCHNICDKNKSSQRSKHHSLPSGISTIQRKDVDMNQNATLLAEDVVLEAQVSNGVVLCKGHINSVVEEQRQNPNQRNRQDTNIPSERERDIDKKGRSGNVAEHKASKMSEEAGKKIDKGTQADETSDMNYNQPKTGTKGIQSSLETKVMKKQGSFDKSLNKQNSFDKTLKKQPSFESTFKKQTSFDNTLKKQGSFENSRSSSPSSLDRRKPWGSPSRSVTSVSAKNSCPPKKRLPGSTTTVHGPRASSLERIDSPLRGTSPGKQHSKVSVGSSIPKPVPPQQREPETRRSSSPQKPKNVRPKIITYVRRSPQVKPQVTDAQCEPSTLPLRLSSHPSSPAPKETKIGHHLKGTQVLCSSNVLFDKYRQEMQKVECYYPPGTTTFGSKATSHTGTQKMSGKSESFHGEPPDKIIQELPNQEGGNLYRSPRTLRPQLGLGAVTRQPVSKTRVSQFGQRAAIALNQPAQVAGTVVQDPGAEQKGSGPETTLKTTLLKPGQSGLRPPGFTSLPPARLAAFGFVRCSSVSSVSSNQSSDSAHGDPCRPSHYPSGGSDSTSLHKGTGPPADAHHAHSRGPQPPNAPALHRRSPLAPTRSSPNALRKEIQKDAETVHPSMSSPKRFAVVSPKPHSPVRGRPLAGHTISQAARAQESEHALVQKLREQYEEQTRQVQTLQAELEKATLGLEVFAITTQHFCQKSESAIVKERELSLELARIRDEVAFSVARWEHLQQDKEELERRFERELQGLRTQQQGELGALEERLRDCHQAETLHLKNQQQSELDLLRNQQLEQIEEMSENHEASLLEMETALNDTVATLQEEHTRTVKNLKMAHEQQRKSLEEDFEKLRLSLQDQVDTLTFQNRSLRDRAKRFEEALRRSTDEQIVDALAPYQHIEEDLKSLKEVLEMKNQQIHQQELKISELEKMAEKNVYLEERVQILQQQNEDLKARIDKNLAVSRQLSEENANLQVNVEKESNEKKRLSRTNEELLWRLQTGELSPRMSPTSSPIHRASPGPGSPARPHSYHQ